MTVEAVQARLDWWRVLRLYLAAQAVEAPRPRPRPIYGCRWVRPAGPVPPRPVWWALRSRRGAA